MVRKGVEVCGSDSARLGYGGALAYHPPAPLEPEPPHPADLRPSRFHRSNRDLFAALASGFVGALALASSIYTVYLQRQQIRASVWPRLDGRQEQAENDYKLFLVNRGAGSAILRRFRLIVDGQPSKSWRDFAAKISAGRERGRISNVWTPSGALNPGAEMLLVEMDWAEILDVTEGQNVRMEICYCSSLDDCWNWVTEFGSDADETVQVPDCHADPVPFREETDEERKESIRGLHLWLAEHRDGGADAAPEGGGRDGGAAARSGR
jgi:hypothetical protein